MSVPRQQLSTVQQIQLAVSVGSPKGIAIAVAAGFVRLLSPRWWRETAPWYAGRAVEALRLKIRIDGNESTLPADSRTQSFNGLLWLEQYETLERYAIAKWVDRSQPVVELGAAIGVVSCLTNKLLADRPRHVCVEANPALLSTLRENRDRNSCQFEIIHAAVAYGGQTVDFGVSPGIVSSSTSLFGSTVTRVTVRAIRLQEVIEAAGFDTCTLICDIEGAEREMLISEADVLRRHVRTVIVEVHPEYLGEHGLAELHARFVECGFTRRWHRGDVWVLSKNN